MTDVLVKFLTGASTAKEVGVPAAKLAKMVEDGLLVEGERVKTGKRGRPAFSFSLSRKGRKVAQESPEGRRLAKRARDAKAKRAKRAQSKVAA